MAKHIVKCPICGEHFDASAEPYVMVNKRRYAHKICAESAQANKTKEEEDREILEEYIKELFNLTSITPKIKRQIKVYHEENNYSYSGMYKTLKYFFEIKNNSVEKANGGIGIIPYVWNDALVYWRSIWEAQQQISKTATNDFILSSREVRIAPPCRKPMKHIQRLFSFLEEEVDI